MAGSAVDARTGHRIDPAASSVTFRDHRCERLQGGVRDAVWGRVGERREHRLACGRGVGRTVVRLYLWSFRMGGHPEHLTAPVGEDGRRAVIIANALDDASAHVRRAGAERELATLVGLGIDAVELDLREYFGQEQRLRRDLTWVSLAWLRGGNVFILRYALRHGGVSRLSGGIGRATNRPNARTIAARGDAPVRPALRMLRARRA
jgi:hypothetical protein